ncbi:uncharacterized protein LOC114253771 [Monomorium pharaonis]|uniref:uncharacterized protein LOC114253771 n=1 Tax=Monomorium pharaonis TaxID=307658 RepID=UPI00102E20C0|nr:uncharacterized protein LOC114253771 [Monomorium pharaonis]
MKFKLCQDAMNVTGVRIRIYDEERCIHEHDTIWSDGKSDLGTLMQNLRDVQLEVNDFLTTLIQQQDVSINETVTRSIALDTESDSVEETEEEDEEGETQTNSKKCKLST